MLPEYPSSTRANMAAGTCRYWQLLFWRLNYPGVIMHFNAVCIMRFRLEYEPHMCSADRRNHLHDMCHRNVRSLEPTISRENLFSFELHGLLSRSAVYGGKMYRSARRRRHRTRRSHSWSMVTMRVERAMVPYRATPLSVRCSASSR